jgi:hypothetical protein
MLMMLMMSAFNMESLNFVVLEGLLLPLFVVVELAVLNLLPYYVGVRGLDQLVDIPDVPVHGDPCPFNVILDLNVVRDLRHAI